MVRWDSPLFTVPWTDADIPGDEIWIAVTEGIVKPPNAGTTAVNLLRHFLSLIVFRLIAFLIFKVAVAPSGALHTLEQTSAAMVSAIMAEQAASQGIATGGVMVLPLSPTVRPKLNLPARNITLAELQRLKRQFVTIHKKAITLGTTEKGAVDWNEQSVAEKFVAYLEENFRP